MHWLILTDKHRCGQDSWLMRNRQASMIAGVKEARGGN